ncbi:MAG: DNA mismatch repair endonuclease MutL [Selenomonadaceae bacterium]|nr:DNA mismatch repair endonuclease MutL [Selenomonadaceae bacterium]
MSIIHLLDDSTINKIAAGEVVERPASAIKELVENAIDAGSTRIEVEIMAGGTSFMRVTDNGKGMSMEDARMAIQRHATSKIREVSDLTSVATLGFRGEALPTIASVSRFTMLTREADSDLGTQVTITGGKDTDIREAGCSLGTTIRVEDLFFNTPARKKFLKTNHTETAHISDFLTKLALSHPEIAFRFISNNKTSMVTPGKGNLTETIRAIYGQKVAESLLGLEFVGEEISVDGYITKPSMLKASRSWQTCIVNGRIIQNRAVAKAIDNAYKALIPKSGYPFAVLNIQVPQRTIDVNVHPQKSELKFEDESSVFKAVYKAVHDALRPAVDRDLTQVAAVVEKPHLAPQPRYAQETMQFHPAAAQAGPVSQGNWQPKTFYEAATHTPPAMGNPASTVSFDEARAAVQRPSVQYVPVTPQTEQVADGAAGQAVTGEAVLQKTESPCQTADGQADASEQLASEGNIFPIGQVDLTYIIAQDAKGLYIVDQHAAHERILFDRFSALAGDIPAQQLLVHLVLSFDGKESELIAAHQDLFRQLGFDMEPSGDDEFRLREIPADIPVSEAEDCVREILTNLMESHATTAQEIRQACLATTACRAAIKAGEELSRQQMQIILEELAHTPFPFTCPHGRPTILKFSSEDLAKMFKRTGFGF